MEHLEDLKARLVEDGFNFTPVFDDQWHRIKQPIRGCFIGSKTETGAIMTIRSWDNEFKKTYKAGRINGESDEIIQQQLVEAEKDKVERNEKAAIIAKKIWDEESLEGDFEKFSSPYLLRKGLGSKRFGARLDRATGTQLLVPCFDGTGKLWGIQRIYASGDKIFIKGQRKEGCFHQIGDTKERIYISEGFATAASVHLATGNAAIVAFDAGNLKRVAKIFREKYPQAQIIIAGDNDEGLTGQQAAIASAKEIGGHAFYPATTGKDWNDCLTEKGLDFLKECFQTHARSLMPQPTTKKYDFHIQELEEIHALEIQEPEWLCESFLPAHGISALFGKPKAGKSTLARDLMVCVAEGTDFLNRKTKPGRVLYLAMEENLVHLRDQLTKRGAIKGSQASKNISLHCSPFLPNDPISRLIEILSRQKDVKLVIFDTLFKILRSKDEHAYQENMQLLEKLAQIAEEFKLHILAIHHAKKGDHADGDAALGSTAITGAFDANIFLRLDEEKRRIISSQHRYGEPFEKTILTFNRGEYRFTVGGSVSEIKNKEDRTKIWAAIREAGEPVQALHISQTSGIRKQTVLFLLSQDVKDGLIVQAGKGTPQSPKLFALSDTVLRSTDNF